MDREKVIKALEFCTNQRIVDTCYGECPYAVADDEYKCLQMKLDALELLKESVPQRVVDQIRWERDTAFAQLEQIGKGLGSKMDDIVALLKEKEGKPLRCKTCTMRDKTGFCHRWNIEVKDDDYCSFGAWKGC